MSAKGVALFLVAALPVVAGGADCTYDRAAHRDGNQIRAEVSRLAAAGGKRRSVLPGIGQFSANRNYIDDEIFATMKRAAVYPAALSSDSEFLRRVTIDLAGRIPTSCEILAFLDDASPDKRDRAIDRLIASNDFNDRWTLWFGDLVQNVTSASDVGQGVFQGRTPYYKWIREQVAARKPYDAMVRELLTSRGEQLTTPAANYFVRLLQENGPPQDTFDNVATQSGAQFLALPMNCVSCHDGRGHLEQLNFGMSSVTRRQLWGMSAFFSRIHVEYVKKTETTGSFVVSEKESGEYTLTTSDGNKSPRQPRQGESDVIAPRYLDGREPAPGEDRRTAYARFLTTDRQFARAAVNYLWKELFGLGIVEPSNSFDLARLAAQATHPELLEKLTDDFIESGYDLRSLIRRIAQSNAYQLSGRHPGWQERYTPYFARHYPRRMMAEVLLDSIYIATGRSFSANEVLHGPITKAVAAPDPLALLWSGFPQGRFLLDFGQGDRDSIARSTDPSLVQNLTLLNDPLVLNGLRAGSHVQKLVATTGDLNAIVDALWIASLSRPATASERDTAVAYLNEGPLLERAQDLQFVLLNKLEFLFY
jgi:Protein of unknown function (DUF1553)/Protein of unknown function (DUF1549)